MDRYRDDSFFTLGAWEQAGLAALSLAMAFVLLCVVWKVVRGRPLALRIAIAVAAFHVFLWLSPQVYYGYYRLIIDGLPRQSVIGAPPSPGALIALLGFQGPGTLSAHGQGVLGWALLAVAIVARSGSAEAPKP